MFAKKSSLKCSCCFGSFLPQSRTYFLDLFAYSAGVKAKKIKAKDEKGRPDPTKPDPTYRRIRISAMFSQKDDISRLNTRSTEVQGKML